MARLKEKIEAHPVAGYIGEFPRPNRPASWEGRYFEWTIIESRLFPH
jgi:hypothetical protein